MAPQVESNLLMHESAADTHKRRQTLAQQSFLNMGASGALSMVIKGSRWIHVLVYLDTGVSQVCVLILVCLDTGVSCIQQHIKGRQSRCNHVEAII